MWNFRHHPKRELWFAWWVMVIFYQLYGVLFFFVTRVQPPPSPAWDTPTVVRWFDDHGSGILAGFAVVFLVAGMCAPMNALLAYSMRRMSVSRVFAYSYLIIYSLAAVPGHAGDGHRDDYCGSSAGSRPPIDPVALRFRVLVVQRDDGRIHDRLPGLAGGRPARQEPRVPEVVRLPEPVQRADGSRRRAGVDLPARRLRLERCDRLVDQHGGVRSLHRRIHRVVAEDD